MFFILILKIEDNEQNFQHNVPYYYKEGKNAIQTQTPFINLMKKVLWIIERVKSGFQSVLLVISRQTLLHSRVDQLELISNKSVHLMRIINPIRRRLSTYTKYLK